MIRWVRFDGTVWLADGVDEPGQPLRLAATDGWRDAGIVPPAQAYGIRARRFARERAFDRRLDALIAAETVDVF